MIAQVPLASSSYLLRNGRVRLTNITAAPADATLYAVPNGDVAIPTNVFYPGSSIPANDYVDVDVPQLAAGDALWASCLPYGAVILHAVDGVLLS